MTASQWTQRETDASGQTKGKPSSLRDDDDYDDYDDYEDEEPMPRKVRAKAKGVSLVANAAGYGCSKTGYRFCRADRHLRRLSRSKIRSRIDGKVWQLPAAVYGRWSTLSQT